MSIFWESFWPKQSPISASWQSRVMQTFIEHTLDDWTWECAWKAESLVSSIHLEKNVAKSYENFLTRLPKNYWYVPAEQSVVKVGIPRIRIGKHKINRKLSEPERVRRFSQLIHETFLHRPLLQNNLEWDVSFNVRNRGTVSSGFRWSTLYQLSFGLLTSSWSKITAEILVCSRTGMHDTIRLHCSNISLDYSWH